MKKYMLDVPFDKDFPVEIAAQSLEAMERNAIEFNYVLDLIVIIDHDNKLVKIGTDDLKIMLNFGVCIGMNLATLYAMQERMSSN